MHRIGPDLMNRQMIIAEYCEKIGQHELQAAHAEEERRTLREELWRQEMDFREVHQQILVQRWRNYENSKVLHSIQSQDGSSSRTRTLLWNYQVEYKNYKNEVNCMNDFRTFRTLKQDAVEIPTLPVNQCYSLNIRFLKGC